VLLSDKKTSKFALLSHTVLLWGMPLELAILQRKF
jgi:hypothetical protein